MLSPSLHLPPRALPTEPVLPPLDPIEHPALAIAHLLAGGLLEVCGPLFWTALIVGFCFAEFGLG